jgi:hypothetical protein
MVPNENWHRRILRLSKLTFNKMAQRATHNASMRETESYFGDRLISKNLWPQDHETWRRLISSCGVYWRAVYTAISREQLTPSKTRYGGRLLPLPMSHYQKSSPVCRLACKSAWTLQGTTFSTCSSQTLFCNTQGKYMSVFIGNHTKIKKLLRNVWVS